VTDDYVSAAGLGLAISTGPVFSDVSFSVGKGALAVVAGPSGSGRSSLLLAIAGRMRRLSGSLRIAGFDGLTQTREIRSTTSIARVAQLVDLEGQLTVADSITERALTDGLPERRPLAVFEHAEAILDRAFQRDRLVDELSALDRTLLAVALAGLRPAHVLVLDDADRQLELNDQRQVMSALLRLTATGVTVVASTLGTDAAPPSAVVVPLSRQP
jgi:ABC-2 type transport system ATP-binding protein